VEQEDKTRKQTRSTRKKKPISLFTPRWTPNTEEQTEEQKEKHVLGYSSSRVVF